MNNAILTLEPEQPLMPIISDDLRWQAVLSRDGASDGKFVFAVSSTGVYCRPSCPSRRPRRENVCFFSYPSEAETAGFRACMRCRPKALVQNPRHQLVKRICRFIEQHLDEPLTLATLSHEFGQSTFHLQRTFKAVLGITPKDYADSCRMRGFRQKLKAGHSVTRAMHDVGYGSTSRLYSRTASELGMDPAKYRRGAIAAPIRYGCTESPLGRMLIAATERGICSIQFGDSDEELEQCLRQEFPFAVRRRDDEELVALAHDVIGQMRGSEPADSLPLDIRSTAFQRRVWTYLQSVGFGETRSYADVAKAIRRPSAVRAVARACATNPVAIAIPCHRVIRSDGQLGGYRWGSHRKEALLQMEAGKPGN
ncbi:MAG TPA: bifunctional DNA-binding transcriptional regulator/O6-methylguanine-DNA methyltransferase Ada [Terriglobales bacterium]|nr:bifunctional DNA-binding transcriptional regulator/O6-methylguanine-DNA methyltransferase Ada [Terriglobales bacterium]